MRPPSRARLVTLALPGELSATDAALLVRDDAHPFALTGAWADSAALVGSEPVVVASPGDDPLALLDVQPQVDPGDGPAQAVGGGWFGYLGYRLGARLERVPPPGPRPVPLPDFALCFYDHLLRLDDTGRWWFEALWSTEREPALRERLATLRARLAGAVERRPTWAGTFEARPPGGRGHMAAVADCRERIAAGDIFQANICMRLEGRCEGEPADLFARAAGELRPRHAAFVAGPWGALCSLSPELFLRRRGREVLSEPIKGTAPLGDESRRALERSGKDRAENVMIVDLMRNDLGRVCEYGSVEVTALTDARPAPGVWHLVSTVRGTLREDAGDEALLRATFPPGSITGAPKIQTMRVIAELEAVSREAYTGAIGYASPVAGLELNVAIRTLELSRGRAWLGVGGGVVADSDPHAELEECLLKARPLVAALGGTLAEPARGPRRMQGPAVPRAFTGGAGGAGRPEPARGVFSTMLARDGEAVDLPAHLARLRASVAELYGQDLPGDAEERLRTAAAAAFAAPLRLRALTTPGAGDHVHLDVEAHPVASDPSAPAARLAPVALAGGLGAHKWRDRDLLAELSARLGAVPLLVDLDGEVLEAAAANIVLVEGDTLVTPPLDGRLLPGTVRAALVVHPPAGLELREEPVRLERLAAAGEILLCSSVGRVRPAALGAGPARFEVGRRVAAALADALPVGPGSGALPAP